MLLTNENIHAIAASFCNLTQQPVLTGIYPQYIGVFEKHKVTALRTVRDGDVFYDIKVEGESICNISIARLRQVGGRIDLVVKHLAQEFLKGCYPFVDTAVRNEVNRMMDIIQDSHWDGVSLGLGLVASKYRVEVMSGTTPFLDIHHGNELVYSAPHHPSNYTDVFAVLEAHLKKDPLKNGMSIEVP